MTLRAVLFDFGGVLVRTEFQSPRQHLAERLGLGYEQLVSLVFDSETARQATLGVITEDQHWEAVLRTLHLPVSERKRLADEFFAGDVVDRQLADFARSLRPRYKVGLLSNAWSGLRAWIVRQGLADIFDQMIISAEVGVAKPDAAIFRLALGGLNVRPDETVFVDDFLSNVEAARQLGMTAIHFTQPESALTELKNLLNSHA